MFVPLCTQTFCLLQPHLHQSHVFDHLFQLVLVFFFSNRGRKILGLIEENLPIVLLCDEAVQVIQHPGVGIAAFENEITDALEFGIVRPDGRCFFQFHRDDFQLLCDCRVARFLQMHPSDGAGTLDCGTGLR